MRGSSLKAGVFALPELRVWNRQKCRMKREFEYSDSDMTRVDSYVMTPPPLSKPTPKKKKTIKVEREQRKRDDPGSRVRGRGIGGVHFVEKHTVAVFCSTEAVGRLSQRRRPRS